jgi:hypothetical protein
MKSTSHLVQAEVVLAGMRKLTAPDDYLAIVDGAMVAGCHFGNALLHDHGVSADDQHITRPSGLDRAIDSLPEAVRAALAAFAELEKLRFDYVRSTSVYKEGVGESVWRNLDAMREACRAT